MNQSKTTTTASSSDRASEGTASASGRGRFERTQWTMVLKASDENAPDARAAMDDLARIYWPALYGFIRCEGYNQHDAEDLTQSFYHHFQERRLLERVKERRGKFRSFLLTCLKHFLADQRDRAKALKRGGGHQIISLDALEAEERDAVEPADGRTADQEFERRWARTLLKRAETRLRAEGTDGPESLGEVLMSLPEAGPSAASYAEVASRFGMTVAAVKSKAHRLRARYQEILREEIGRTVACRQEIDEEIRYMIRLL